MNKIIVSVLLSMFFIAANAQREELIPFADFEQWLEREVKESGIIGGKTKVLYEVAPNGRWNKANGKQNKAYVNQGGSPWATSNVYARVSGISKSNTSVYKDRHANGYCAKLITKEESVKVLGIVNISVLASGSIFTGEMLEPVTGTDNPMAKMSLGIPFSGRPKAIKLDYRVKLTGDPNRIRKTGFSKVDVVPGKDMPEMIVILQQRTEDVQGNITAKRVGTIVHRFSASTNGWLSGQSFSINYGDITGEPYFTKNMGLLRGDSTLYARNSKGNVVPINEDAWASADAVPTHAIVKFDSSTGGAYTGSIGTTLWLDNIRWEY